MLKISALLGLAVYALTILAPALLPNSAVYADGEQYAFNLVDASQKAALDSCMQNHKCDRGASTSDLYNIALFMKGGVYGSAPIQLNYEPYVDTGLLKSDEFAFTGNYTCQNFSVSVLVTVDMGNVDNAQYPARVFLDNIRNNDTGEDTSNVGTGTSGNQVDNPLTATDISQGAPASPSAKLPSSCLPGNLNQPPNATFAGTKYVRLQNYNKMSASQKKGWPGVDHPAVASNLPSAASTNNGGTGDLECATSNPLNWVICPVVSLLVKAIDSVDGLITDQLAIGTTNGSDQPTSIFADSNGNCSNSNNTCASYYRAWASFRDIALGLMVVAGLIIVIAQALGVEVLDAYTLRKALPRLLIAAIAITLSWPLMKFGVTLANDLGYGVRSLIEAPFSQPQLRLNFGDAGTTLVLGFGSAAVIGAFGLLSFALTGALAVFVAILVLIVRQVVITLLLIFAPIAIVSYILPNTQRVYRLWWDNFIKALLMFPLIVAFIAAGHVFSAIALAQSQNLINQIIGFAAYFAPYFMIPMTFRMAGGIMGGFGNIANSAAQGGFKGLQGFRASQRQKNLASMRTGTRFEGKKWLPGTTLGSKALNRATGGVALGWKGRYGVGKRGSEAYSQMIIAAKDEIANTPGMKAISGKNDYNRILAMGMGDENRGRQLLAQHLREEKGDDGKQKFTEEEIKERVNDAARGAHVAGGFTQAHGVAAFMNMARDGTAIRDVDDLANLAAIAGQGNNNATFGYAAQAASVSRQVGRSDLAAASEPIGEFAFAKSDSMFGKGLQYKSKEEADEAMSELRHKAWLSGAGGESMYVLMSNAKGRTVRNNTREAVEIVKAHQNALKNGAPSPYTPEEAQTAAALLVETQQAVREGHGRFNNRQDATKEMQKDGGALEEFLGAPDRGAGGPVVRDSVPQRNPDGTVRHTDEGQPMYRSAVQERTNRDVVAQMVAQRGAAMSDELRNAAGGPGGGPPGGEEES